MGGDDALICMGRLWHGGQYWGRYRERYPSILRQSNGLVSCYHLSLR